MRLPDFLDFHARERPDSEFAVMGDRTVTYSEASKWINQLANAFTSAGLNKGDRVAFLFKTASNTCTCTTQAPGQVWFPCH